MPTLHELAEKDLLLVGLGELGILLSQGLGECSAEVLFVPSGGVGEPFPDGLHFLLSRATRLFDPLFVAEAFSYVGEALVGVHFGEFGPAERREGREPFAIGVHDGAEVFAVGVVEQVFV